MHDIIDAHEEPERLWLPFTRGEIKALRSMVETTGREISFAKILEIADKKVRCAEALEELLAVIPRPRIERSTGLRRLTLAEMELDI